MSIILIRLRQSIGLLLLLIAFISLVACFTTPATRDRGSLSDAFGKASKNDPNDRHVQDMPRPTPYPTFQPPENPPTPSYQAPLRTPPPVFQTPQPSPETSPELPPSDTPNPSSQPIDNGESKPEIRVAKAKSNRDHPNNELFLGIQGGGDLYSDSDLVSVFDINVGLIYMERKNFDFAFMVGVKWTLPRANSLLESAVAGNVNYWSFQTEFRWRPFADWKYCTPFLGLGASVGIWGWNYKNPLLAGSDVITSDTLAGFSFYAIVGVYVIRTRDIAFNISILPQILEFGRFTGQGFNNDYFSERSSLKLIAELSINLNKGN